MNPPQRTAVVVGASISGLASALCLAKEGYKVTVLEAGNGSNLKREIVLSPPNMTRILETWNIDCATIGPRYIGAVFIDGRDIVGELDLPKEMVKDLGADYYYFHYSDLIQTLTGQVQAAGGKICLNSRVCNIDPESGTAFFQQQQRRNTITADLIILADGRKSKLRHRFVDQTPSRASSPDSDYSGSDYTQKFNPPYSTLVGHVSREQLDQLKPYGLDREGRMTLWMASHAVALGLITANGGFDLSFRFCPDDTENCRPTVNRTGFDAIPPHLLQDFSPDAQRLLKAANLTNLRQEPTGLSWAMSNSPKVITVGNAAHPWVPTLGGGQRHAMEIEDAATLQRLVSLRLSPETVLSAYNAIRGERWEDALISDRERFDYICLPPSEFRQTRNVSMRAASSALAQNDDSMLSAMWGSYLKFFNYDAVEAVDEWWHVARHSSCYSF